MLTSAKAANRPWNHHINISLAAHEEIAELPRRRHPANASYLPLLQIVTDLLFCRSSARRVIKNAEITILAAFSPFVLETSGRCGCITHRHDRSDSTLQPPAIAAGVLYGIYVHVWCGLWIIVAHVARWKLQWLYQYRDYVWEAAVVFITMGTGIMYLAVDTGRPGPAQSVAGEPAPTGRAGEHRLGGRKQHLKYRPAESACALTPSPCTQGEGCGGGRPLRRCSRNKPCKAAGEEPPPLSCPCVQREEKTAARHIGAARGRSVALGTLLTSTDHAAVDFRANLPLSGYYRPGRYMPVQWNGRGTIPPFTLHADAAVATIVGAPDPAGLARSCPSGQSTRFRCIRPMARSMLAFPCTNSRLPIY